MDFSVIIVLLAYTQNREQKRLCFSSDCRNHKGLWLSLSKSVLLCNTVLILVLSLVALTSEYTTVYHVKTQVIEDAPFVLSYTSSGPILIQSDADFETQGWPGNGTEEDPYMIEGLRITSESTCISISDTSTYFEVVSCLVSSNSLTPNPGIEFDNVMFGSVKDCEINTHDTGVTIFNSIDCAFINNTLTHNQIGIYLNHSVSCKISENTVSFPTAFGILIHESNGCLLSQNLVQGNQEVGISLDQIANSIISNCSIVCHKLPNQTNMGLYGLLLDDCILTDNLVEGDDNQYGYDFLRVSNCTLIGNSVNHCSQGLTLQDFVECTITENKVFDNSNGIYAFKLENCTFVGNSLTNNQHGIEVREGRNCSIIRNVLMNDLHDEFTLTDLSNCSIIENEARDCQGGYCLQSAVNCTVLNNTATHNERYGFKLDSGCENNTLYLNRIGLNDMGNAVDDGTNNKWDNGNDTGNYWADYDGEGYYEILGDAGSLDRFPFYWDLSDTAENPLNDVLFIGLAAISLAGLVVIVAYVRRK